MWMFILLIASFQMCCRDCMP